MRYSFKRLCILATLLFIVITVFSINKIPETKATLTRNRVFTSSVSDGDLYKYAGGSPTTSYQGAHDSSSATVEDTGSTMTVGQHGHYSSPTYSKIWRMAVFFEDTGLIPSDANITNATLSLYLDTDQSNNEFNITIQQGQTGFPHNPLQSGDYYYVHYSGDGGYLDTSGLGAGYNNITLDADGRSWINDVGTTSLMIRSDWDINTTMPQHSSGEYVSFKTRENGESTAALLYVTYDTEGYAYNLYGAYDEYGLRDGAINVTMFSASDPTETHELDGTLALETVAFVVFTFDLGDNETRTYYTYNHVESIYVFKPDEPYYTYTAYVQDFVGLTNGYLETTINVNGSTYVVERWSMDALGNLPFKMAWGWTYTFRVVADEGSYSFMPFTADQEANIPIIITRDMFPEMDTTLSNIEVYALRLNITFIQTSYTDSTCNTTDIVVEIYRTSDLDSYVATNQTASNTFDWNWTEAVPEYDYIVKFEATHLLRGTLTWWFPCLTPLTYTNPFGDLSILGTFIFPLNQLVGLGIIVCFFGIFSYHNASLGIIVGVLMTATLVGLGWLNINASWLVMVFAVAILSVIRLKKRGSSIT